MNLVLTIYQILYIFVPKHELYPAQHALPRQTHPNPFGTRQLDKSSFQTQVSGCVRLWVLMENAGEKWIVSK
jgi:hypothetical protein